MNRDRYRKTTADLVRTGENITNDWARANFPGRTLAVDYPTRDVFINPEGVRLDRIRFTGTDSDGRKVDKGWGLRPGDRVYVVSEAPLKADMPGSGVFGGLADDEPADLDAHDPFDIDTWELL